MAKLVHCSPNTSVAEAVKQMKDNQSGTIVVVESQSPVGTLTDRDVIEHCLTAGKDINTTHVGDIMNKTFHTVTVDYGIGNVLEAVRGVGLERIVVVNERGQAVGLLALGDLFGLLAQEFNMLAQPEGGELLDFMDQAA